MVASVWGDGIPDEAFEIPPASIISEQSASYSIIVADAQKLIDYIGIGAGTFTLPASADAGAGFVINIRNSSGAGILTIARVGSDTIEGSSSLNLDPGTAVQLILKSANYGIVFSRSIGAAAVSTAFSPAGTLAATNVQAAIEELNAEKAALAGSSGTAFSVGTATANAHAIGKAQAEAAFATAQAMISQTHTAFTTTGTATVFVLTPTIVQSAYAAGMRFRVKFHLAAGATPTINVSGLGAKALMCYSDAGVKQAITATTVPINLLSDIEYDGTDFVVLQPVGIVVTAASAVANGGALNQPASGDLTNCTSNTEAVGTNNTQLATTAFCEAGFVNNDVGVGAVGTIAICYCTAASCASGATVSGANIFLASLDIAVSSIGYGAAQTGTWRNIGSALSSTTFTISTFQRIS